MSRAAGGDDLDRARTALARLAIALTAVVVATSAFLRHAQSGVGCEPWPECYGRVASQRAGPDTPGVHAARIGHRIAATGVGIVVAGLVMLGWMRAGTPRRTRTIGLAALALVIGLAALGAAADGDRMPGVAIGNLLGGHLLLALLIAVCAFDDEGPSLGPRARFLAITALVAATLQPALGGAIDAQHALPACATFTDCADGSWRGFVQGEISNPFRNPRTADGRFEIPPSASGLFQAHMSGALAFAVLALATAFALGRSRPKCAAALGIATLLEVALGLGAIGTRAMLTFAVLHSVLASVPIAALAAALAVRDRATR